MQLRISKHVIVLFVLTAVMASFLIFVGCEKQAKSSAQQPVTGTKTSIAGTAKTSAPAKATAPAKPKACKAPATKKACPAKSEKKPCAKKAVKSPANANAVAKQCPQMMCAMGDGKAANKNICCEHKGKKYCFCCESCKKQFEKDPEKYTGKCK